MTRLTGCPDAEAVATRAAEVIARSLARAREERGEAHLALSGGSTPAGTYRRLAEHPLDWGGVSVWFADERCVPPDDPESNYRLARETLLDMPGAADARVHRMAGELGPDTGARAYGEELRALVPPAGTEHGAPPALDVVVLGIGPDGHVASLFPGSPALDASEEELCLGVRDSPKPPPERITLTLPVLRSARSCVLIATGASKADALAAMLGEPTRHVPASLLRRGRLTVIADDAASPVPPRG